MLQNVSVEFMRAVRTQATDYHALALAPAVADDSASRIRSNAPSGDAAGATRAAQPAATGASLVEGAAGLHATACAGAAIRAVPIGPKPSDVPTRISEERAAPTPVGSPDSLDERIERRASPSDVASPAIAFRAGADGDIVNAERADLEPRHDHVRSETLQSCEEMGELEDALAIMARVHAAATPTTHGGADPCANGSALAVNRNAGEAHAHSTSPCAMAPSELAEVWAEDAPLADLVAERPEPRCPPQVPQ